MFEIRYDDDGRIRMEGRLDAARAADAQAFLDDVSGDCVIDMAALDYVSSAGLGVLLRTHKRLAGTGHGLKLVNLNRHINDIFAYSGFDKLFDITPSGKP